MTRQTSVRRTVATVAVAPVLMTGLLTGLVACDGDSGADDAGSSTSQSAPSAEGGVEAGDSVDPADFTDQLAAGLAKITTADASVEAQIGPAETVSGEGEVDYTAESPSMAMTLDAGSLGGDIEVRVVEDSAYVRIGDFTHGKFWKLDLDSPDSPLGALGSQLDLKSSLELLEGNIDSVTYVGEEDVDGQALHHYRATVDAEALLGELGPRASAGASALPDLVEYDVWLDEQGRPTKLTWDLGRLGSVQVTLSDLGTNVDIEAPPADEVIEMPGMFPDRSAEPSL